LVLPSVKKTRIIRNEPKKNKANPGTISKIPSVSTPFIPSIINHKPKHPIINPIILATKKLIFVTVIIPPFYQKTLARQSPKGVGGA
jgi:hypothetical protein